MERYTSPFIFDVQRDINVWPTQHTYSGSRRNINFKKWRPRRQGWEQRWRSPPMVSHYRLSPHSNTLKGSFQHQMMTGRKWSTTSGKNGRTGCGCHGCWEGRGRMPGCWGCSMLRCYKRSLCMGWRRGSFPHTLGRLWKDSSTGWFSGWRIGIQVVGWIGSGSTTNWCRLWICRYFLVWLAEK